MVLHIHKEQVAEENVLQVIPLLAAAVKKNKTQLLGVNGFIAYKIFLCSVMLWSGIMEYPEYSS